MMVQSGSGEKREIASQSDKHIYSIIKTEENADSKQKKEVF